jgi:transposase
MRPIATPAVLMSAAIIVAQKFQFSRRFFGITEGFHRKMKLIQRRAYGFRNFENYRLRVRVLCG